MSSIVNLVPRVVQSRRKARSYTSETAVKVCLDDQAGWVESLRALLEAGAGEETIWCIGNAGKLAVTDDNSGGESCAMVGGNRRCQGKIAFGAVV